jgi:hypothetical protein
MVKMLRGRTDSLPCILQISEPGKAVIISLGAGEPASSAGKPGGDARHRSWAWPRLPTLAAARLRSLETR